MVHILKSLTFIEEPDNMFTGVEISLKCTRKEEGEDRAHNIDTKTNTVLSFDW